jgi:VWFA-related protein
MSKWLSLSCLALAGLALAQTGAPLVPTFRVGTRLVQVDVVVLNDKTPVRGLTKDDFTVQDKGKTQNIAIFGISDTHNAPKADPLPPNVSSNRMNNRGESTSGATVILFDKMNTPSADQVVARRQTLALLSTLKQADHVAFYSLDTDLTMVQDFTGGAERLANAAKALEASDAAPAGSPEDQALLAALRNSLTAFQQAVDGSTRVASTMTAFRTIVRHLDGLPGRKNLIWMTASIPFTYGAGTERRKDDEAEFNRMEELMSDANVAVYAVDPRGAGAADRLSSGGNTNSSGAAANSTVGKSMGGRGGGKAPGDIDTSSNGPIIGSKTASTTDSGANEMAGNEGMQKISEDTGGKAYYNTNDLAGALREILDTTEITYTLGFYVDDKALDNKKHDLSVKLAKKPETAKATLHYRKSYEALKPQTLAAEQPRPPIGVLAADALDASAVGIMAATAPNPNNPGNNAVQVRVDLADLTLARNGDKWNGAFDLGLAMQGAGNKLATDVNVKTINLSLTDAQLKQGLAAGLIVDNTVPTPAQPMRLRVVVQDKNSGAGGSVRIPIGPK